MQIDVNLRDFLDSFIIDGGTGVSIYTDEKLVAEYVPVANILMYPKYKKFLTKKVSYVDLYRHNDSACLMITIKDK